jgi:hypothetical protein
MSNAIILAGATHTSVGHATPMAMGIMIGIMLIIWIVGKLFSE